MQNNKKKTHTHTETQTDTHTHTRCRIGLYIVTDDAHSLFLCDYLDLFKIIHNFSVPF